MDRITKVRQRTFSLAASTITKIADADANHRRSLLMVQNQHATDVADLRLCNQPWCVRFASGKYATADNLAADPAIVVATSGAIVANVRPSTTGSGARTIFGVGVPGANTSLTLKIESGDQLHARLMLGGVEKWCVQANAGVALGEWATVSIVHDGTKPALFVNGSLVAQTITVATDTTAWMAALGMSAASKWCRIGGMLVISSESSQFDGDIQTLAVYTGNGVSHMANQVAEYRMAEGAGTTVADHTLNGYTATFGAAGAAPSWAFNCDPIKLPAGNGGATYEFANIATAVWAYSTTATHPIHVTEGFI